MRANTVELHDTHDCHSVVGMLGIRSTRPFWRRFRVGRSRPLALLTAAVGAFSTAASFAPPASAGSEPSWIPYLGAQFDSGDENAGANMATTVGADARGTNSFDNSRLRFSAGLLTPSLSKTPSKPRFFLEGGVDVHTSGSERTLDVGEIGDPERAISRIPPPRPPRPSPDRQPEDVDGQGRFIRQEYIGPAWAAAIGVAFELPAPWDDGSVRLKPLVAYEGTRVRIEGRLTHVLEPTPEVFTVVRAYGRKNPTTDHRVGIGGELELVFYQGNTLEISAFGNVRYLWVVSGRSTLIADPSGIASFSWRQDANVLRGGLGVRVGWTGLGR